MTAKEIANYIIKRFSDNGKPITNLRLQILLYILQREYMLEYGEKLFDEDIYVGKAFPLVLSVYHDYCCYGSLEIRKCWGNAPSSINEFIDKLVDNFKVFFADLTIIECLDIIDNQAWQKWKDKDLSRLPNAFITR